MSWVSADENTLHIWELQTGGTVSAEIDWPPGTKEAAVTSICQVAPKRLVLGRSDGKLALLDVSQQNAAFVVSLEVAACRAASS